MKNIHEYHKKSGGFSTSDPAYQNNRVRNEYLKHIFRTKFTLTEYEAIKLVKTFADHPRYIDSDITGWPTALLLKKIERQWKGKPVSDILSKALIEVKKELNEKGTNHLDKERLKIIENIDNLVFQSQNKNGSVKPVLFMGEDDFSTYANQTINSFKEDEKTIWYQLIGVAQKASGGKPSKKYLDETKEILKSMSGDKFKKTVNDWFVFVTAQKDTTKEYTQNYGGKPHTYFMTHFLSSINLDAIKGLVWMCAHFHDSITIQNIVKLAERCYEKIPGKGPAAAAVGNACLFTLYKSKGMEGIGQLSRLKLKIKQSNTQKIIQNYLNEAAIEKGVSIYEIEDLAVEDFGLVDGKKEIQFDDYKAELSITGVGKSQLTWYKPDGKPQKSIPAFVKTKYAEKLKKLKNTKKQIDQTTSAQRDRIDRMFRTNRKWNMDSFKACYLDHGLMSFLIKKIIWTFSENGKSHSLIYIDGQWVNNDNEKFEPEKDSSVSLWHPAIKSISEIENWRNFLTVREIQQPLKQAFREVYLLTDAELNTKTYSNRMAAHVLKQHQFNMLAKTRGWRYSLMGAYDDGRYNEAADIELPEFNLRAEYWVNELNAEDAYNDNGIWLYITTDQIRFYDTKEGEIIDLANVPPIPFSEVLRDVDLFVGVASVGNDPMWRDSGGLPAYRDYWTSYSFGDLNEVAKNRKQILINLIPRLKIRDIAEIQGKFLIIKGKLRTYKIHIGSTNILMEPNDQYLCIVPDRSKKNYTGNLFVPFEGDTGLSVILSKAFLLADDDKIKDRTITSQILIE